MGKIVLAVVVVTRGRVPGVTERHGCTVANFEAIRKLAFMVDKWWWGVFVLDIWKLGGEACRD